jgi:hypothetical protein
MCLAGSASPRRYITGVTRPAGATTQRDRHRGTRPRGDRSAPATRVRRHTASGVLRTVLARKLGLRNPVRHFTTNCQRDATVLPPRRLYCLLVIEVDSRYRRDRESGRAADHSASPVVRLQAWTPKYISALLGHRTSFTDSTCVNAVPEIRRKLLRYQAGGPITGN